MSSKSDLKVTGYLLVGQLHLQPDATGIDAYNQVEAVFDFIRGAYPLIPIEAARHHGKELVHHSKTCTVCSSDADVQLVATNISAHLVALDHIAKAMDALKIVEGNPSVATGFAHSEHGTKQ